MTIKPDFTLDVVAKVDQVGAITSNMNDVQMQALAITDFYSNLVITENMIPDMKKEKAQINKMKDDVATYRKNIIAEFKKPIEEFETTAKATEKILKEAYDCVNDQIANYENETKKKVEEELRAYFDELCKSRNIDFVTFEQSKVQVTLSASKKKLMEQINDFVALICDQLRAIELYPEEQRTEILIEYKQSLNFTQSVINAQKRIIERQNELARQEALKELKAKEEKVVEKVEEVIAPEEIKKEEIKLYVSTFTVKGTVDQLRKLKEFLVKEGITYDTKH